MKKFWTYVIGILFIGFGILLMFNPNKSLSSLVFYVGVALLVSGGVKILSAIVNKVYFLPGSFFMSGLWNAIFGLLIMANADTALKIVPTFIGIWLIVNSLSNLIMIYSFRSRGMVFDVKTLTSYILKLVCGIIVITTPIISIIFTGTILGIILIVIGVYTIVSYHDDSNIYSVRVKGK